MRSTEVYEDPGLVRHYKRLEDLGTILGLAAGAITVIGVVMIFASRRALVPGVILSAGILGLVAVLLLCLWREHRQEELWKLGWFDITGYYFPVRHGVPRLQTTAAEYANMIGADDAMFPRTAKLELEGEWVAFDVTRAFRRQIVGQPGRIYGRYRRVGGELQFEPLTPPS